MMYFNVEGCWISTERMLELAGHFDYLDVIGVKVRDTTLHEFTVYIAQRSKPIVFTAHVEELAKYLKLIRETREVVNANNL
jgi:hypothetical protein